MGLKLNQKIRLPLFLQNHFLFIIHLSQAEES